MFGHQNDVNSNNTDDQLISSAPDELGSSATVGGEGTTVTPIQPAPAPTTDVSPTISEPTSAPIIATSTADNDDSSTMTPAANTSMSAGTEPAIVDAPPASDSNLSSVPGIGDANDLLGLKQQALQQLSPLIDHLDQSPEEKFRTTMMMIQANDDQSLIKNAYASAQEITDEKVRAQALLDVVNEINYFTQKKS